MVWTLLMFSTAEQVIHVTHLETVSCTFIDRYWCVRRNCCLHLQGKWLSCVETDGAWHREGKIGNRAVSQYLAINHPLVWLHSKQGKCQTNVNTSLLNMDMHHIFHLIKILWIKISCYHHSLSPTGAFSDLVFVTFLLVCRVLTVSTTIWIL
jgi:hypothetical protein